MWPILIVAGTLALLGCLVVLVPGPLTALLNRTFVQIEVPMRAYRLTTRVFGVGLVGLSALLIVLVVH